MHGSESFRNKPKRAESPLERMSSKYGSPLIGTDGSGGPLSYAAMRMSELQMIPPTESFASGATGSPASGGSPSPSGEVWSAIHQQNLLNNANKLLVPASFTGDFSQSPSKLSVAMTDPEGNTTLHLASMGGQLSAVISSIQTGTEVDRVNLHGATSLLLAVRHGHFEVAQFLREAGADVNKPDHEGLSPLLVAVQNGSEPMVELLTNANADLNFRHKNGCTALELAVLNGSQRIAEILRNADRLGSVAEMPYHSDWSTLCSLISPQMSSEGQSSEDSPRNALVKKWSMKAGFSKGFSFKGGKDASGSPLGKKRSPSSRPKPAAPCPMPQNNPHIALPIPSRMRFMANIGNAVDASPASPLAARHRRGGGGGGENGNASGGLRLMDGAESRKGGSSVVGGAGSSTVGTAAGQSKRTKESEDRFVNWRRDDPPRVIHLPPPLSNYPFDLQASVKDSFVALGGGADGSGGVDMPALEEWGREFDLNDLRPFAEIVDLDGDGNFDYHEFKVLLGSDEAPFIDSFVRLGGNPDGTGQIPISVMFAKRGELNIYDPSIIFSEHHDTDISGIEVIDFFEFANILRRRDEMNGVVRHSEDDDDDDDDDEEKKGDHDDDDAEKKKEDGEKPKESGDEKDDEAKKEKAEPSEQQPGPLEGGNPTANVSFALCSSAATSRRNSSAWPGGGTSGGGTSMIPTVSWDSGLDVSKGRGGGGAGEGGGGGGYYGSPGGGGGGAAMCTPRRAGSRSRLKSAVAFAANLAQHQSPTQPLLTSLETIIQKHEQLQANVIAHCDALALQPFTASQRFAQQQEYARNLTVQTNQMLSAQAPRFANKGNKNGVKRSAGKRPKAVKNDSFQFTREASSEYPLSSRRPDLIRSSASQENLTTATPSRITGAGAMTSPMSQPLSSPKPTAPATTKTVKPSNQKAAPLKPPPSLNTTAQLVNAEATGSALLKMATKTRAKLTHRSAPTQRSAVSTSMLDEVVGPRKQRVLPRPERLVPVAEPPRVPRCAMIGSGNAKRPASAQGGKAFNPSPSKGGVPTLCHPPWRYSAPTPMTTTAKASWNRTDL